MSEVTMMTPPSEGATAPPPRRPAVWPTVVGILGIVWASFGLLSNFCGFFMTEAVIKQLLPEEMQEQILSQLPPSELVMVSSIIGFILSLWLLWGSIKLLRRDSASRMILNGWSVLSIVFTIGITVWMFMLLPPADTSLHESSEAQASETTVESSGADKTADSTDQQKLNEYFGPADPSMQRFSGIMNSCCGGVVSCLWPIFLLIFLNMQTSRREIGTWGESILGPGGDDA